MWLEEQSEEVTSAGERKANYRFVHFIFLNLNQSFSICAVFSVYIFSSLVFFSFIPRFPFCDIFIMCKRKDRYEVFANYIDILGSKFRHMYISKR